MSENYVLKDDDLEYGSKEQYYSHDVEAMGKLRSRRNSSYK
jgi:hypothetical protein